ncbi:MAG: class I SAM-dependent methyltransferase [Chloroflexota bacterium]
MNNPDSSADRQEWDRIASVYAQTAGTAADSTYAQFKDALWESLGDLQGLDVLDLGCGHGWLSQQIHEAGAKVWGVDGAPVLIEMARTTYPHINFTLHDLLGGLPPTERTFDRVVSNMVLMDIPDITVLIASVRAVLKPHGRFIFTLPHPCFFNYPSRQDETSGEWYRMLTGYLQPAVWRVQTFGGHNHYHRTLTEYMDHLRHNHLVVTRFYEPPHRPKQLPETYEKEFAFYQSIPIFLLIEAVPLPRY